MAELPSVEDLSSLWLDQMGVLNRAFEVRRGALCASGGLESRVPAERRAERSSFCIFRGLSWPEPKAVPRSLREDDDDEEDEDEDEEAEAEDGESITSLERSAEKVCFDFRLGELPRGVEHEGEPARLTRTADSGDATVLSVPAGGYIKLPLEFPDACLWRCTLLPRAPQGSRVKDGLRRSTGQLLRSTPWWSSRLGACVDAFAPRLRWGHPRPLSIYQATWPEVSATHATISECIVDEGRVVVGGAESEALKPLKAAQEQKRFVRLFLVCNAAEGQMTVYVPPGAF